MLPSVMETARQHGLQMDARCSSRSAKEVRFKCPFCETDANKRGKYYLSLNMADNLFKCWACGEGGGVLKFIALLEHKPIEEVKQSLWGSKRSPRRSLHPAEKLTPQQLKAMGFVGYSFGKMKQSDPDYQRTLNWIWQEWQSYSIHLKRLAYIGVLCLTTTEAISANYRRYSEQLSIPNEDLIMELTTIKFSRRKPEWATSAEEFVAATQETEKPIRPDPSVVDRDKREKISC